MFFRRNSSRASDLYRPDPEEATISWSKSGRDAEKFSRVAPSLSMQPPTTPGDSNGDVSTKSRWWPGRWRRTLTSCDVRVKVTNVAETGTIEFSSLTTKGGVVLAVEPDDPNGRHR